MGRAGIYDDRNDAELMVSQPSAQLPCLSEAVEEWHALLLPFKHHGSVKWTDSIVTKSAIQISSDAPDGPLVVVTTAGFDSREPNQHPRIASFLRGVLEVLDYYGTLDGNLRRASYAGDYDQREGFTASILQNEAAMMQAAYWAGTHRTLMDRSRDGSMFDRSSFTRARLVHSNGSWDGDPLAD